MKFVKLPSFNSWHEKFTKTECIFVIAFKLCKPSQYAIAGIYKIPGKYLTAPIYLVECVTIITAGCQVIMHVHFSVSRSDKYFPLIHHLI